MGGCVPIHCILEGIDKSISGRRCFHLLYNVKLAVLHSTSSVIYRLPMGELIKRLKGHIVRIDHTGVNIPASIISNETWQKFIHNIAEHTNLYKYPTNDTWPFILPATEQEFKTDITQFPAGREPKFELVYDSYDSNPTIQIDVETDLTRIAIEQLLPDPYSVSFLR